MNFNKIPLVRDVFKNRFLLFKLKLVWQRVEVAIMTYVVLAAAARILAYRSQFSCELLGFQAINVVFIRNHLNSS